MLLVRVALLCLSLTGCGRIGFSDDPTALDADGGLDGKGAGDPSLLVWFSMDEAPVGGMVKNAGTADLVARCSPACPKVVPGRVGQAFAFDGVSSVLRVALGAATITSGTLAMWSRYDQLPTTTMSLLAKPYGTGVQNSWEMLQQPPEGGADATLTVGADAVGSFYVTTNYPRALGVWTHLAVVFSASTGLVTLFFDGDPRGTVSFTTAMDASDLFIGGDLDNGGVVNLVRGDLDDVRIYDRALSAAEIKQLALR